jgi:hypothetical protein
LRAAGATNARVVHSLVVDGHTLGLSAKALGDDPLVARFDFGAQESGGLGNTPTSYVLTSSDVSLGLASLRNVAQAVYGDSNLWYVIAEANGLGSDADIVGKAGMSLVIPNTVTSVRNDFRTFKPYDPTTIRGDNTPTMPMPKGDGGCGTMGTIIIAIVAVVATIFTAGAAAIAMGAIQGATLATASLTTIAGAGVTVVTGGAAAAMTGASIAAGMAGAAFGAAVIGGAVGNAVSQGVAIASGMQSDFSWKGVAAGAIGSGVGFAGGALIAPATAGLNEALRYAAVAAGTSALRQGVMVATGLQNRFNWTAVAASAVAAPLAHEVGQAAGGAAGNLLQGVEGARTIAGVIGGFANGLTTQVAVTAATGGKVRWQNIAADAFGNALGQGLVDATRPAPTVADMDDANLGQAMRAMAANAENAVPFMAPVGQLGSGSYQLDRHSGFITIDPTRISDPDYLLGFDAAGFNGDLEKARAFVSAMTRGKSFEDSRQVANLVDVRRQTEDISRLIDAHPDDPSRSQWVQTRRVLTAGLISKDVYFNQSVPEILPAGIYRISQGELNSLGYGSLAFENGAGYFGALYHDTKTASYVFANRGTEGGEAGISDWLANFSQTAGLREGQFGAAIDIALALKGNPEVGDNLTFTGHSLGGGIAAAQAMRVAGYAVTFNAENVSRGTIDRYGLNTEGSDQRVDAYYVNGDVLSRVQDNGVLSLVAPIVATFPKNVIAVANADWKGVGFATLSSATGQRFELPAVDLTGMPYGPAERLVNTVNLHFMDYVLKSLQTQIGPDYSLPRSLLRTQ